MANNAKPFPSFSQLVPGFEFLRSLTGAAGSGSAVPGLSGLSHWVAPTLSVEELDKRIRELKTVQFWLEQNVHALKATIQALEVQKMTLSALKGMNVRMEDLAKAFTRGAAEAAPAPAPKAAAAPVAEPPAEAAEDVQPEEDAAAEAPASARGKRGAKLAPGAAAQGVVDTLQWWNALTQQFQQIASDALQDAAQLRLPSRPDAEAPAARRSAAAKRGAAAKTKAKRAPARKKAGVPAATRKR